MSAIWGEFGEERGLTEPVRETVREMASEFSSAARQVISAGGANRLRFFTFGTAHRRGREPQAFLNWSHPDAPEVKKVAAVAVGWGAPERTGYLAALFADETTFEAIVRQGGRRTECQVYHQGCEVGRAEEIPFTRFGLSWWKAFVARATGTNYHLSGDGLGIGTARVGVASRAVIERPGELPPLSLHVRSDASGDYFGGEYVRGTPRGQALSQISCDYVLPNDTPWGQPHELELLTTLFTLNLAFRMLVENRDYCETSS